MHSHDRTLLAKLGFADPDKRNPDHDAACLYLSQPETVKKVAESYLTRAFPGGFTFTHAKAKTEYHLQKGEDQYATTIGFVDVAALIHYTVPYKDDKSQVRQFNVSWFCYFEVKIEPVAIGDVMRQLNLYDSYTKRHTHPPKLPKAILAAPWPIDEPSTEALRKAGFGFVLLGQGFSDWKLAKLNTPPASAPLEL